jgi:hypothetical protein
VVYLGQQKLERKPDRVRVEEQNMAQELLAKDLKKD